MKQLFLAFGFMLLSITIFAQTPVGEYRVTDETTVFTVNIPKGTKIFNQSTKEYWVAVNAIAAGATVTLSTVRAAGDVVILTPLTLFNKTTTSMDIKAALTGTTPEASSKAVITLPSAVKSTLGVGGTAGLLSAIDAEKLSNLSNAPEGVGSYTIETFEEASGTATKHLLLRKPKNVTSITVALNGSVLKGYLGGKLGTAPSQYTLALADSSVTIAVPVLQYDVVTIGYTY